MPHWDDERSPPLQEDAESAVLGNSVRSLGISREQWLADYYRLERLALKSWRNERAEQRQIIPIDVEGLGAPQLHNHLQLLFEQALAGKLTAIHSAVLSPFDPVIWDRKRAEQLFDLSYRLKCYTPAPEHQYGCFVLPLLHRRQLVGGMDVKMHRKTGVLDAILLWLQDGAKPGVTLQKGLSQVIDDFAR